MKDVIYGVAKTIMDGMKDTESQYLFAVDAIDQGRQDISVKHRDEAIKRLAGVKEWYDFAMKTVGAEKMDPLAAALMDYIIQWHKGMLEKISTIKPGA